MGCINSIPEYQYDCGNNRITTRSDDSVYAAVLRDASIELLNKKRLQHEAIEEYEWCAFIRDLISIKKRISEQQAEIDNYLKSKQWKNRQNHNLK